MSRETTIVIKCDRCKVIIEHDRGYKLTLAPAVSSMESGAKYDKFDLCHSCTIAVIALVPELIFVKALA